MCWEYCTVRFLAGGNSDYSLNSLQRFFTITSILPLSASTFLFHHFPFALPCCHFLAASPCRRFPAAISQSAIPCLQYPATIPATTYLPLLACRHFSVATFLLSLPCRHFPVATFKPPLPAATCRYLLTSNILSWLPISTFLLRVPCSQTLSRDALLVK